MTRRRQYRSSYTILAIHTIFSDRRGVHDVTHKLTAVGSRSIDSAQQFIKELAGGDSTIRAYGSYDEVFADKVFLLLLYSKSHTALLVVERGWSVHR